MIEMRAASRPSTWSVASMTCQLALTSPGLGMYVLMSRHSCCDLVGRGFARYQMRSSLKTALGSRLGREKKASGREESGMVAGRGGKSRKRGEWGFGSGVEGFGFGST